MGYGTALYALSIRSSRLTETRDWDWHLDTKQAGGDWIKSPLFDNQSGFGGNGAKVESPFMPKNANHGQSRPDKSPSVPNSPSHDLSNGFTGGFLKDILGSLLKDFSGGPQKASPSGIPFPGDMFMGGSGGGCVEAGPFKDMKLHIGPFGMMKENNIRCLKRSFNAALANSAASQQVLDKILSSKDFGEFRQQIEVPSFGRTGAGVGMDFHSLGHGGIGGEV
jgi:hypothetical protein